MESSYLDEGYFKFPFKPYKIQEDFMKKLYQTIDNEKIGIFESPTGTGKSLSLICGALTWLKDYEKKKADEIQKILSGDTVAVESTKESDEPDWVDEFFRVKAAKELSNKLKDNGEDKKKRRERLASVRREKQLKRKREQKQQEEDGGIAVEKQTNEDEDDELVLKEYFSDSEEKKEKNDSSEDEVDKEEEEEKEEGLKIFYCSRTHSQLSQFIHEIQKSPYGEDIKVVALGSRQNYCINKEVRALRYTNRINEKCLDLQKKKSEKVKKEEDEQPKKRRKKKEQSGCPYYNHRKLLEYKEHLLDNVQDIEQLTALGKDLETCPYYGSRHSISDAQLVVLPYQTLLHKSTRESVGVNLKGNIVIVDEAHNLIETINNIHSVEVTLTQITTSFSQLSQYRDKYRNRLKAKNLMYIEQILFVLKALTEVLVEKNVENKENTEVSSMLTINNFLCASKIDNVNLFKIRRYCENSLIARKLNGFIDKYHGSVITSSVDTSSTSQFLIIQSLFDALTNFDKDGRILITKSKIASKACLKFLLLNPSVHFVEVIKECKSIVFAGGTMEPISEFKDILLHSAGVTNERIIEFSAGHVIPPENLIAVSLGKGPSSIDMNFTYQNRSRNDLIDELGRILCNICTVVPGGVVCFFPSYDYEELVYTRLSSNSTLKKIEKRKKVFREPRKSGLTEKILLDYSNHIKKSKTSGLQNGALLLSIVGGKMSEGINFSDDLGRCIIMVGLPYPNKNSPELKEKMEFLNKNIGRLKSFFLNCFLNFLDGESEIIDQFLADWSFYAGHPNAGIEHYENICMKAVNQSIGRAIRHKEDYACILMIDQRYSKLSVQNKLPSWIRSQLVVQNRFGPSIGQISKFFVGKRKPVT